MSRHQDEIKAWLEEYGRKMDDLRPIFCVYLCDDDDDPENQVEPINRLGPTPFAECDEYTEVFKHHDHGGHWEIREEGATASVWAPFHAMWDQSPAPTQPYRRQTPCTQLNLRPCIFKR